MTILRVKAKGDGRIVSWSRLKQGQLVDAKRFGSFSSTTTLTDVVTDLCALCQSLDGQCRLTMVFPNGPTTAAFDLTIIGNGFQVLCGRRLIRGWFPLNPFAAECGANYDVIVTVDASSNEAKSKIVDLLQAKYAPDVVA